MTPIILASALLFVLVLFALAFAVRTPPPPKTFEQSMVEMTDHFNEAARIMGESLTPAFTHAADAMRRFGTAVEESRKRDHR